MPKVNGRINLRSLLGGVQLPALPQSAMRLLQQARNPDCGPADLALPIEADPGLASQVLRFVNSSYFGFVQEVSSVKLAITLVGTRTIKNFALWTAVFSLLPNPRCGPFDLKHLWQDSLRRAIFARLYGKYLGMQEAEDLFAAALLQDLAIPLLAKELPDDYQKLLERRRDGSRRLSDLELDHFGWTHAEAGGLIARQWKLPESIAEDIEQHTQADSAASSRRPRIVSLSSLLPPGTDHHWHERDFFLARYWTLGEESLPQPEKLFENVDDTSAELAPLLKVPTRPLAHSL